MFFLSSPLVGFVSFYTCVFLCVLVLGGKVFLPVALPLIQRGLESPEWTHRHAALSMLAEMANGCHKFMKPKADEVLQKYFYVTLRCSCNIWY